jgi:sugar phosphate isomerase/epimerase
MKLGLMASLYDGLPFERMLERVVAQGLEAVEIGAGNYPGDSFLDARELLADEGKLRAWKRAILSRGLELSALACHGNPLHPDRRLASQHHATYRAAVLLAERLGVGVLTLFSSCPGDGAGRHPNWVTCAWPPDFLEVLRYQWDDVVIPYWVEQARFARDHHVRLAFEMHPGMVVYNPATLLRLREACGESVGVNFDPSHLYWQGIDPVLAIRKLGAEGCVYHVHAKDTAMDPVNAPLNGVLDTRDMGWVGERSWTFRTVGYVHDALHWKRIVSALRTVGYDHVLSIEHEDPLTSADEGLGKAARLLRECILAG